jgi:uncharacterized protein YyaL (SSP411 family)
MLDDYAYLVAGLLDLYEANFESEWLREALQLTGAMTEHSGTKRMVDFSPTAQPKQNLQYL